ncbi:MAG: hypothetical protein AAF125_22530, partial [Chloroflexota bacterium]
NPYGIVEGFWFPELTCDLNPGWERIIFDWAQHQPNGPTDWHTLNVDDRWLKAANQCDREVVALLKNTPAWATRSIPGAGVPTGLYLSVDDPQNHWANFVRQAAAYYAPRGVHRFIIWNEPDISRETFGFEFDGSLEDYARMVKVASIAARQGNPAAQIHLAGTTYWHNINEGERLYLDALLEALTLDPNSAENDHYFDAISLHIYFRTDTVYELVMEARRLLDSYGLTDKVIWINETNAPPTQDPDWPVDRPVFKYTLEQQAAFLVQAGALAPAAGVERVAVYKLFDQALPPGGESFGILVPGTEAPRPAFDAWRTVTQTMTNRVAATRYTSERVDMVVLEHATAENTAVVWSRVGEPIEVSVDGIGLMRWDALMPDNGLQAMENGVVTLAAAICNGDDPAIPCPVGGMPLVVRGGPDMTIQEIGSDGTMMDIPVFTP